jgi:glucosamine--fructose-6-phosphate aminotransferase (isomerizing)
MCGIIGILGKHEAAPIIVEALKRLEYRGYDSSGIATVKDDGSIDRRRAVGKLLELQDKLVFEPLKGKAGIGHTRWATHGEPNEKNAHPHTRGAVSVVHNGIIENFLTLREELKCDGYNAETDTDSETIAVLCSKFIDEGDEPLVAARKTVSKLTGSFAIAMLFEGHKNLIFAARSGSPLAVGYGKNEMYLGSDALALLPLTKKVAYLEEGDHAVLTREGIEIYDIEENSISRQITHLNQSINFHDKSGFNHFMEKEIHEQPIALERAISSYLSASTDKPTFNLLKNINFTEVSRIIMVACGTAHYACYVAKYWIEKLAKIPVEIDIASEFRYREPPIEHATVAIFVSQSGETADTLAALRYCSGRAEKIISIVNVSTSSIARESDEVLEIHAGPEIGVASTKAFTCQLAVLFLATLKAAKDRSKISSTDILTIVNNLKNLPATLNQYLGNVNSLKDISYKLSTTSDVLFLGRGLMYPLALEGALKLKEISYIHAEGYASGELKHGPIALIDDSVPVIILAPYDNLFEKSISNMQEVIARKANVIVISDNDGLRAAGLKSETSIEIPKADALLAPFVYALPIQLLAYFTAVFKGTDVDQPRNLAKSVTVE